MFQQQINNMTMILTLLDLIAFVQYFFGFIFLMNSLPVIEEKNCDRYIYGDVDYRNDNKNYNGKRMDTK